MADTNFKRYYDYEDCITDFLFLLLEEEIICIVVNYKDYGKLISALQEKNIYGKSLTLDIESFDNFDNDIDVAKNNSGNMLVTVFKDSALIIGEPMLYTKALAYVPATYYVEKKAESALSIPFNGAVIPFMVD